MSDPTYILTALEPAAGAGLALNLAYLNLGRFRYRGKIRDQARNTEFALQDQCPPDIWTTLSMTDEFLMLGRLARIKDHDLLGGDKKPKKLAGGTSDEEKAKEEKRRNELKSGTRYRPELEFGFWFLWHQDRVISSTLTVWCAIVLYMGVWADVSPDIVESIPKWFQKHALQLSMAAIGMVFPITVIWRGGGITRALIKRIHKLEDKISATLNYQANSLTLPDAATMHAQAGNGAYNQQAQPPQAEAPAADNSSAEESGVPDGSDSE